jgi:hypothetical protein
MPTFYHGKSTSFTIQDLTSTARDISPTLREVSFPVTIDTPETTAFGAEFKSYVVGIKDGRFSCSGMFDATASVGPDVIFDAIYGEAGPTSGADSGLSGFGFVYGPSGTTATRVKYTGRVHLTNYQIQGSVSDMVAFSADFQVTSLVQRGTY